MKNPKIAPKIILGIFLLLLGGALLTILAKVLLSNAKVLADTQENVDERQSRVSDLEQLQSQYKGVQGQIQKVSSLLPDESNFTQLVEHWEQKASALGLTLKIQFDQAANNQASSNQPNPPPSVSVTETTPPTTSSTNSGSSPKGKVVATLQVAGKAEPLFNFWQAVEEGRYFVKVLQTSLESPNGLAGDGKMTLKIEILTDETFPPN